ncbi:hypothetical protein BO99DRAFT_156357 [Aspergillus violaceofuscus CBS 115571]|uniref:Secreted protein n=1 Tax=Aspergillus violaceofuscus (strain CBS 115571) TaxID=1450538 RepID=A0A2V5IV73_ASPV1|nr:hypothetical protein BO99DRAFT_156357 [Aspergillus violaceofuscus CBS 115571]
MSRWLFCRFLLASSLSVPLPPSFSLSLSHFLTLSIDWSICAVFCPSLSTHNDGRGSIADPATEYVLNNNGRLHRPDIARA